MQDDDSLLPIIPVQGHLYSDFLGGPDVEVSAVFLIRTHGHASHGHGVHVHLSHGTTAAIHVHHTVCCRAPLVGELLLGKGAVPGQVSWRPALYFRGLIHGCGLRVLHHGILGGTHS